ncbi:hypothetical protein CTRI78_v012015 [Colletotrichum trifolii]|uniref:Uncharacterized protein n=1 Tax=Colletotrichum trifolii TaxID=5466 RepID=A0A4R8PSP5_COLTR|nr:hypothetical protein CTRI78_v012015 [Colletotrichum trifolii]
MLVYGARDIFMGLALYAATLFGTRRTAGCILVAASACVAVDGYGYACKISNGGEWGHWDDTDGAGNMIRGQLICISGRLGRLATGPSGSNAAVVCLSRWINSRHLRA